MARQLTALQHMTAEPRQDVTRFAGWICALDARVERMKR